MAIHHFDCEECGRVEPGRMGVVVVMPAEPPERPNEERGQLCRTPPGWFTYWGLDADCEPGPCFLCPDCVAELHPRV